MDKKNMSVRSKKEQLGGLKGSKLKESEEEQMDERERERAAEEKEERWRG